MPPKQLPLQQIYQMKLSMIFMYVIMCQPCFHLLTCHLEREQIITSRSFTGFANSTSHRRTSSIYGCNLCSTTTNVCEGFRMLSLGRREQEIFGFYSWYRSQCSRTLRPRNRKDNVGTSEFHTPYSSK